MAEQLNSKISCIILAGGQSLRMQGQDKGLVAFRGRPLIEHVIQRIQTQTDEIIISANRNIETYRAYSAQVINDVHANFSGPLAGIASCLPYCQHEHALVVACDMPWLPLDLVSRLSDSIVGHDLAIVSCASRLQLALLLKTSLLTSINTALANNAFKFTDWATHCDAALVNYDDETAFSNLNTGHDLNSVS